MNHFMIVLIIISYFKSTFPGSEVHDLVILHNNNIEGRFDECHPDGSDCDEESKRLNICIGGLARTATMVKTLKDKHKNDDILFLSTSDSLYGTVWTLKDRYPLSVEAFNLLKPDAMALGTLDFTWRDMNDYASKFVNKIETKVVCSNMVRLKMQSFQNISSSLIVSVGQEGRKIGIVGYTSQTKSDGFKIILEDEVSALRRESDKLLGKGIKTIIAIGSAGYKKDKEIAKLVPGIDMVVGGMDRTYLCSTECAPEEKVSGPYPTVITQASGKEVPVVSAGSMTRYLGYITLSLADNGRILGWRGEVLSVKEAEGNPDMLAIINKYRPNVMKMRTTVVGSTKVDLDASWSTCTYGECNYGSFVADAFVKYVAAKYNSSYWTDYPIAFFPAGDLRQSLKKSRNGGNITASNLFKTVPLENKVVTCSLKGEFLLNVLETSLMNLESTTRLEFLQVSGLRFQYDLNQPRMKRIIWAKARCGRCEAPVYENINPQNTYNVITTEVFASGEYNQLFLKYMRTRWVYVCPVFDVMVWYMEHYSPVQPEVDGRIRLGSRSSASLAEVSVIVLVLSCLQLESLRKLFHSRE